MPPGRGLGSGSAKKRDSDTVRILSSTGKTAHQHLQDLKDKLLSKGGPDIIAEGWTCKLEPDTADGADRTALIPVFVNLEGKKFQSRKAIERELGIKKTEKTDQACEDKNETRAADKADREKRSVPRLTREEAYQRARQAARELLEKRPLPFTVQHMSGTLTVHNLGKIIYDRDPFHSSRHIWPIGFSSSWRESEDVNFESEVLDGATMGKSEIGEIDGPVFMVTVKRKGMKAEAVLGKSPRDAWRKALKNDAAEDGFGFSVDEIKRRLEGLKHSKDCVDYVFLDMRQPKVDDHRRPKDKDRSKGGDKEKESKKKLKVQPSKKATLKQTRERDKRDSKELDAKRIKEDAAAKKRQAAEEAARKKREQQEEEKWLSRYPIEDLALGIESKAMKIAEEMGFDGTSQRIAARAAVEAVERGYCSSAALAAAEAATASHRNGTEAQESIDAGLAAAEEWTDDVHTDESSEADASIQNFESTYRIGSRVRMVFSERIDGSDQETLVPYDGVILQQSLETRDKFVLSFRSEAGLSVEEVRLPDPDVQLLPRESLRLPPMAPSATPASYYAADLLGFTAFTDSFRSELELPKGGLREIVEGLVSPWSSTFLGDLYMALLAACFQMAEQQSLTVPPQWSSETTLTNATWPEVLRRWMLFGPRKDIYRGSAAEAVFHHSTMLDQGVSGSAVSPEGHLSMLICLMEDVLEHEDVKRIVDKRLETGDEVRRDWAQVHELLEH
jgi:hypothetical protein